MNIKSIQQLIEDIKSSTFRFTTGEYHLVAFLNRSTEYCFKIGLKICTEDSLGTYVLITYKLEIQRKRIHISTDSIAFSDGDVVNNTMEYAKERFIRKIEEIKFSELVAIETD